MSDINSFLTLEDEKEIVDAIVFAEKNTSGEIRVHIEDFVETDPMNRAIEVFHKLNMHKTKNATGVLIYLAIKSKKFAICGDSGINNLVPIKFWDSIKENMQNHFKNNEFKLGLIEGIMSSGAELKQYFPHGDDKNELSNDISKG